MFYERRVLVVVSASRERVAKFVRGGVHQLSAVLVKWKDLVNSGRYEVGQFGEPCQDDALESVLQTFQAELLCLFTCNKY